ncbi:MAG: alanine:cation symporter family protein [Synechococcus sp. SB0668_bin_15]|nr:alanine:cation symporter family protein [Synechococcus sp. SB0668_bin_15]MXZ82621.1 alanine:cation symporter family protein [Synechococcus sp. SB0666_bin_14]MYA91506.1 alanine:cation symporter family protein [Synechococcus sp. SB0663_bin_10]MYC49539.1 alanine:cation symporter family protein [Synechococcus sp. SB0662_bin_14]MYG45913.1 alanine:cation symporter family protein [Synechococcus sp. SB0675_bin_6]MYJ60424.1 alanine:cation symporter family protein [Synechococcus sp. SB0672_bin_6]MYK
MVTPLPLAPAVAGVEGLIKSINDPINSFAWGWPTVLLIAATGILLMLRLSFMPIQRLGYGFRLMLKPTTAKEGDAGDVTPFQALMTSLSATIGTGNIAGVAGAIFVGGPGAVFWMWVVAFFGIATKYAEAVLAVHYREVDPLGNHVGGPMYYIKNGLGPNWHWLGTLFALFGMLAAFGIGNGVQSFEVASALGTVGVPNFVTGVVLAVLVFLVIIGGVKRIAQVTSALVPFMAVAYVLACLIILLSQAGAVPGAFGSIFANAFTGKAAATGTLTQVILMGFKRGIFSNEAGLGSAPIAHAAAKTTEPVRQGTIAMLGTFIDTIVVCTMTALVILSTGAMDGKLSGSNLSIASFNAGISGSGWVVTAGLLLFALTTILGWSFYGEKCAEFLLGVKAITPFRFVWVAVVVIGCVAGNRGVVWGVADTLNGLMAIPNLIALVLLSGTVYKLTKDYAFSE